MDAITLTREAMQEHLPDARAVLLAGSAANGRATPTSDLDVVALIHGQARSWRRTVLHRRRPVEMFVYTEDTVEEWWQRDASGGHCALAHMCANAVVVWDDGLGQRTSERARSFIAAGPPAPSPQEIDGRRYRLTDALDDLADVADPDEQDILAGGVVVATAELALITRRQWLGEGKWLVRRLHASDPQLSSQLFEARRVVVTEGDAGALIAVADHVLAEAGGRLTAGFAQGG